MNSRLCVYLGAASGGWVGLLVGLLRNVVCCSPPPPPPTLIELSGDALIVALIAVVFTAFFMCLVDHLPLKPVLLLALFIGVVAGVILGPLAYHIPNPGLSLLVCAIVGALLGWLICRVFCAPREFGLGDSR